MKKLFVLALLALIALPGLAQKNRKASKPPKSEKPERIDLIIGAAMKNQENAWNRGDIDGFMAGYWRSDSLIFIAPHGLTYGWKQTLDNYKKAYPDRETMGKLTFTILSVERISLKNAYVIGKWHLARRAGDQSGHYTLLWRKIKGTWVIVSDHTSKV